MSTPSDQLGKEKAPLERSSTGEVLLHVAKNQAKTDPRMARKLEFAEKQFRERQLRQQPQVDPRMLRKIEHEEQRFRERTGQQPAPTRPQNTAPSVQPQLLSARKERGVAAKKVIGALDKTFTETAQGLFVAGSTKALMKATDRPVLGNGKLFKAVLRGLALVEHAPDEKNLAVLEDAARTYVADYDRRVQEASSKGKTFAPDKVTQAKHQASVDALEKVRKLRAMRALQAEASQLPGEVTTSDQEAAVNRVRARMMVEAGGSRQLGADESGASESFFLSDPTTREKGFIFKPSDGEFDAGYGWKKGGGAPREVVLGAVNEALKNTLGLDCGVSTTTLVKIDHPSLGTERNGGRTARVGAIQNFVKSDGNMQAKIDTDPTFVDKVAPGDIEKIALLDFATLQMDRQASNLLVHANNDGTTGLTPIDAGNALPSRKAFEASRRMFANNALLAGAEAKKPFSPKMLQQIQAMDADEIVKAMRKANQDMAAVDPQAGTAVDEENIEIARRSVLFLKKAAARLTKAEIAEAYAYEFHKVLDAKANAVDSAIDAAIQAMLDKPGIVDEIRKIDKPTDLFNRLGWPNDEYQGMLKENPARLLDILRKGTPCKATVDLVNKGIAEIGRDKFNPDPDTIVSLRERLIAVTNRVNEVKLQAVLADPELDRKAASAGADLMPMNQSGERKPMIKALRDPLVMQIDDYLKQGGDDVLRRKGVDPSKMTFEQRYYEQLGGDALIEDLQRRGLNPYDGPKLGPRITDLLAYREYLALGGDDIYVAVGGAQNKDLTIGNRVSAMRTKLRIREG